MGEEEEEKEGTQRKIKVGSPVYMCVCVYRWEGRAAEGGEGAASSSPGGVSRADLLWAGQRHAQAQSSHTLNFYLMPRPLSGRCCTSDAREREREREQNGLDF